MSQYKACPDCKQSKSLEDFYNNASAYDGKNNYCKPCFKARIKVSRKKHPEATNRAIAKWRATHKEQVLATTKAYRAKNREVILSQKRAWAKANPDKIQEMYKRGYAKNPERCIVNAYARSQRIKAVENNLITAKDYARLYRMPCIYCGSYEKIEIDHIHPISKNGRHSIGNLAASCRSCNRSKNDLFVMQWRIKQRKNPPKPKL
jgi:5-methylcytosine-specific restriction endonuclease McrA